MEAIAMYVFIGFTLRLGFILQRREIKIISTANKVHIRAEV
jgi:hypothetical protein